MSKEPKRLSLEAEELERIRLLIEDDSPAFPHNEEAQGMSDEYTKDVKWLLSLYDAVERDAARWRHELADLADRLEGMENPSGYAIHLTVKHIRAVLANNN